MLSAGIAKITANSIFYPLDLIRTEQRNNTSSMTMSCVVRNIRDSGGSFYRGIMLYNAMSVPNFCLMMAFMHKARSLIPDEKNDN